MPHRDRPFSRVYASIATGMALSEMETGRFLDVNVAFCDLTGWPRDEVIGRTSIELGMWKAATREEVVRRVREEGQVRNLELGIVRKDGDQRIALFSSESVEVDGRRCLLTSAIDVTEWRRTEAAYRRVEARLQAIGVAIPAVSLLIDRHGTYREVMTGPGMESLLVAPPAKLRGHRMHEFIPHPVAEAFLERMRRVIDTGQTEIVEYELTVQAGTRWFEARIAPIRGDGDEEPMVLMLAHDITDRKNAEAQLRQVSEQRRNFARQLITIQEQERQRLARELHDDLGQILTALKLECKTIADRADDAESVRGGIARLVERLNLAMTSVRNLVRGLHPNVLTDIGLGAALDSMCRRITQSTALAVGVDVDGAADTLPAELATAIYRIAQEALTNVVRHAAADRVWLRLSIEDGFAILTVEDDGHGADVAGLSERGSLGITSMRERAALLGGNLRLEPSPRGGLRVQATVPL